MTNEHSEEEKENMRKEDSKLDAIAAVVIIFSLVAIAVSAAIRCEYCIAAQIEFAKKAGANDEEIKAAIQIAAEIQRFSTLLYGNEFDVETFNKLIGRANKE